MYKIYTKIDSWFQKSPEESGQLQTSTRKLKELKFDGLLLSKNEIYGLLGGRVKIHQIPHVNFGTKSQFFF